MRAALAAAAPSHHAILSLPHLLDSYQTYIHTYIEGVVVMRFHIIEKLSQNFDVTTLMILTF